MPTQALDLVTMGHALDALAPHIGNGRWQGLSDEQRQFFAWYEAHRKEITELGGLEALASTSYKELNDFLKERGFEPQFRPFDRGVGVASILDMLVEWRSKGVITEIEHYDRTVGKYGEYVPYPAFQLGASDVEIFDVEGVRRPLARLHTKTGHSLWLMESAEPPSGLALAMMAQRTLSARRKINSFYSVGVVVPMLEISVEPDLSWMLGAESNGYTIDQAFQQFRLRANEQGARVKIATGFAVTRGGPPRPMPLEFDKPFLGFFTQPGHDNLPMAAFYADIDSWGRPEGELEEL